MKKELMLPLCIRACTAIRIAACVATLFLCSSARATLTSIGLFTGNRSETWESFDNYTVPSAVTYLAPSTQIMGGAAKISNPLMAVYEPGVAGFGLGTSGPAQVSDGRKAMGLNDSSQVATIVFANPVFDFGAYWGAATGPSPLTDPTMVVLLSLSDGSSASFSYSRSVPGDGLLEWHGWHSDVAISKLSYNGDYVVIDGLQANMAVPEPSTVLAGALLMLPFGMQGVRWLRNRKQAS